jgi:GNAT superfamily N-acetyltransferase
MRAAARPSFRLARRADLAAIVALLADDALGATRELVADPPLPAYVAAFEAIDADPNNELVVACCGDAVVAVLQLTYTPYLVQQGAWRATIEGVRVASTQRSQGIGAALFEHAFERARVRGCRIVQLTTDKRRPDARRFYERLGFVASHDGMKRPL